MSKTTDKYIIERLEKTERENKWLAQAKDNLLEELKETQNKLNTLANMFEKTESDDGKYSWYKVKGNFLISSEKEAYKIIEEQLTPEEEMPF